MELYIYIKPLELYIKSLELYKSFMYVFFINVADHFVIYEVCDWTLSTTLDAPEITFKSTAFAVGSRSPKKEDSMRDLSLQDYLLERIRRAELFFSFSCHALIAATCCNKLTGCLWKRCFPQNVTIHHVL